MDYLLAVLSFIFLAQPPILPPGLAGKYAGALFSAANKSSSKALSQVETDLNSLKSLMASNSTISTFLANPTLDTSSKTSGLKDVLSKLGGNTSELTKNFLNVLAENGRLYETGKVLEGFEQIMSAHRGELTITITCQSTIFSLPHVHEVPKFLTQVRRTLMRRCHSFTAATDLDKATVDRLKKSIESSKIAKEYKSLKVQNKIQPDLLGGIIVDFGDDKTVDLSVKSRVQKLEALITRMSRFLPLPPFLNRLSAQ